MWILADESGDFGFSYNEKSPSKYFVITLLVCEDVLVAKKIKSAIRKTLQKVNHKKSKTRLADELKGSDTSLATKRYFFDLMEKIPGWRLYAIILDKVEFVKKMNAPVDRARLYNVLVHEVLKDVNFSESKTVTLLIDKSQNGKGIKDFDNYLRTSLNLLLPIDCVLNITHEVSHQGLGIQAVDMFCYGFFRKHEFSDLAWYGIFQKFILSERKYKL